MEKVTIELDLDDPGAAVISTHGVDSEGRIWAVTGRLLEPETPDDEAL